MKKINQISYSFTIRLFVASLLLGLIAISAPAFSADTWSELITIRDIEDEGYVAPIHVMLLPSGELMFFAESRLTNDPNLSSLVDRKEVVFKITPPSSYQLNFPEQVFIDNLQKNTQLDIQAITTTPALGILDANPNVVWTHNDDFVCSGHTLLADGQVIVVGGTRKSLKRNGEIPLLDDVTTWNDYHVFGIPFSTIYDGENWTRTTDFLGKGFLGQFVSEFTGEEEDVTWRWYSTATRLKDSKILITAGQDYVIGAFSKYVNYGGSANVSIELYDPDNDSYDLLIENNWSNLPIYNVDYTHVFQLPQSIEGRDILMFGQFGIPVMFSTAENLLFESGTYRPTRPITDILDETIPASDVAGAVNTTQVVKLPEPNYGASTSMLPLRIENGEWGYQNGSVIIAGGNMDTSAHTSADVYDPYANSWLASLDMEDGRHHPSTVLLPDGKVLILAGHSMKYNPELSKVKYVDPANNFNVTSGSAEYPEIRGYHSVSILLPDGRVLIAGGTDDKNALAEKPTMRYYSPEYIFEQRPEMYFLSDNNFKYGEYLYVTWDINIPVEELVLMSLGSMTHSFDANQRYVQLEVMDSILLPEMNIGATLFKAPQEAATAPAGDYMLFAIDENRVPSVSKMIHLD